MIDGIDISRWQGDIQWGLLPEKYKYVVMRASIGNYYTDPRFEDYFDAVCDKGLVTGAYHVLRGDNDVESQLARFESAMNGRKPDMLVLDCEVAVAPSNNILKRRTYWMMKKLDERWPTPVKLYYTAKGYWDANIGATYSGYRFDQFLLWVASYGTNDGNVPDTSRYPSIPDAWKDVSPQWWMWQYTSKGVVPGIPTTSVDLNGMREDFFAKLDAKKGCADDAPPPPPPPDGLEERVEELELQVANIKTWGEDFPA